VGVSNADGILQGRYSNGQTRNLGQVVLATFSDSNGLLNLGNNEWSETSTSGPPLLGAPGTGTRAVIQSATVEDSNVDLTKELVDMISAQRNYQANAQTIKTQDQVMQTLVNLR
jgi:flagellar hook protein FlgE